jgi:hypothetical protein
MNSKDILKKMLQENEEQSEIEYVYGSVVMDTKDIRAYNDLDENHCILRTYFNDSYCIGLGIDDLKSVMAELTGENITIIRKLDGNTRRDVETDSEDDFLL